MTVPLPTPLPPDVMCTHVAEGDAVHVQPAVVVIVNEPVPPVAGSVPDVGFSVKSHDEPGGGYARRVRRRSTS